MNEDMESETDNELASLKLSFGRGFKPHPKRYIICLNKGGMSEFIKKRTKRFKFHKDITNSFTLCFLIVIITTFIIILINDKAPKEVSLI